MTETVRDVGLCNPCRDVDLAWLSSTPVMHGIRLHVVGKSLTRKELADDHYARVRWQRALIARLCAEQHQGIEQLTIFEAS